MGSLPPPWYRSPDMTRLAEPPPGAPPIEQLLLRHGRDEGFAVTRVAGTGSGGGGDGGKTFLFLEPFARFTASAEGATLEFADGSVKTSTSPPLAALRNLVLPLLGEEPVPWAAGALSYELLHTLETVPAFAASPSLPLALFYLYRTVLEFPFGSDRPVVRTAPVESPVFWRAQYDPLISIPPPVVPATKADLATLRAALEGRSNFTRGNYMAAVATIKELIRRGEVYQVNLSQRFTLPFAGDPERLFLQLLRAAAPPRGAYLSFRHGGTPAAYVSASPELLLESDGVVARSEPIKGTRRRGTTAGEDEILRRDLAGSRKDLAELSMIVDLVRNDFGREARIGSVEVRGHAELRSFPSVHHLMTEVRCEPRGGTDAISLLEALFPAGSITGAPKIAAMKTIASLERCPRGIYTGALGHLGGGGLAHLNVAIRTGTVVDDTLTFSAGGGITIDSDEAEEYDETLAKARDFYGAWLACGGDGARGT